MKKIKNDSAIILISFLSGAIIGAIINRFIDFPYFKFDININAVELLSIFTTAFFGIIISNVISRNNERSNQTNRLYIDKIIEAEIISTNIEELCEKKELDFFIFVNRVNRLDKLVILLRKYNIVNLPDYKKLIDITYYINKLTTTENENVQIVNGKITISKKVFIDISMRLDEFNNIMFDKKLCVIQNNIVT